MLLWRSSRVDAVNELYKPRNERNKGRQAIFPARRRGDEEREGGIDRSRGEIDPEAEASLGIFFSSELSLLFTVDNDLESGRGLKTLLSFHLLVPAKLNYRRR